MFWIYLCCLIFATSARIYDKGILNSCSIGEFSCSDGACITYDQACDGKWDCLDGSDEIACNGLSPDFNADDLILHRTRRQSTSCRRNQWQCRDGSCIGLDGKCDGVTDCPDGSDETFPLCRNTPCQSNWFRCTYGACVDGTAPCNGVKECADDSDELLPRCRNETEEIRGQFRCDDGQLIPAADHCDGTANCNDGSDETVRSCAGNKCPGYAFQCAYGACVDEGSNCDGVQQCADGSDESDELCNRIAAPTTRPPMGTGNCIVPPSPPNGVYSVVGQPSARPGQRFKALNLNVTCNWGFRVKGKSTVLCFDGSWADDLPECIQFCRLNPHESVEYRCVLSGEQEGTKPCTLYEPSGTVVRPECRKPNYYSPSVLPLMRCIEGSWDTIVLCQPGLAKNGTNITVIIRDKIELYVSSFLYASAFQNSGDNSVNSGQNSVNSGQNSLNIGHNSVNSGDNSVNSGPNSMNSGHNSVNSGDHSVNSGPNSMNSGHNSVNSVDHAVNSADNSQSIEETSQNTLNEIQNSWSFPTDVIIPIQNTNFTNQNGGQNSIFTTNKPNDLESTSRGPDNDIDYADWRMGSSKKKDKNNNIKIYMSSNYSDVYVHAPESAIVFL